MFSLKELAYLTWELFVEYGLTAMVGLVWYFLLVMFSMFIYKYVTTMVRARSGNKDAQLLF